MSVDLSLSSAKSRFGARCWLCGFGLLLISGCPPAPAPVSGAGAHVGDRCQRADDCGDGLTCHYEGSSQQPSPVCRLEVGRCRFDRDCGPEQGTCRRMGVRLGVCEYSH